MSSQLGVRFGKNSRRTVGEIKHDYLLAVDALTYLERQNGAEVSRLQSEYNRREVELRRTMRRVGRMSRQLENQVERLALLHKAEHLRHVVIPGILQTLSAKVSAIESAQERVAALKVEMATRSGIAPAYRSDIKIVLEYRGCFSIYFGGIGQADGPGHAHYAFDENAEPKYRREPTRQRPIPAWRR